MKVIQVPMDDKLLRNLDDIFTIRKERSDRVPTTLLTSKMELVNQAIKFALALR